MTGFVDFLFDHIIAAFFLAGSAIGLALRLPDYLRFRSRRTVRVMATVTAVEHFRNDEGEDDHVNTFAFTADRREIEVKGRAFGDKSKVGARVELIYPDGMPEHARPDFGRALQIFTIGLAAVFVVSAAILAIAAIG